MAQQTFSTLTLRTMHPKQMHYFFSEVSDSIFGGGVWRRGEEVGGRCHNTEEGAQWAGGGGFNGISDRGVRGVHKSLMSEV